jgi:hypothetical protein
MNQQRKRLVFDEWLNRCPLEVLREVVKMERQGLLRQELERCLAVWERREREYRREHGHEIAVFPDDVPF